MPARPEPVAPPPADHHDALLHALQCHSFGYFVHEANPCNGLVLDKTAPGWPASIAAVGMAPTAWPVGVERRFFDYVARGVPDGPDDGTLAPWAVVASLPFTPELVLPTIWTDRQLRIISAAASLPSIRQPAQATTATPPCCRPPDKPKSPAISKTS